MNAKGKIFLLHLVIFILLVLFVLSKIEDAIHIIG